MKHIQPTIVALLLSTLAALHAADTPMPNIVFLLSDDQRFDSLGITGDPVTQTPNLDRLAREGVSFQNAYITSPICGPSRANIFTGQWERRNHIGFTELSQNFVSQEAFDNSWLMQLKKAGYSTAFIGKHHTKIVDRGNTPLKKGIDFCYFQEGHLGFHLDKHKVFSNLKNKTQIEGLFEATEAYLKPGPETDYFFANADPSIKTQIKRRDPDRPFCAWINFNLPHAASIGGMGTRPEDPSFYSTLYADQAGRFVFPNGYPLQVTLPAKVFTSEDLMPYYRHNSREGLLDTKIKMDRAVYAIDQFVGNLQQLLKAIGEAENTIIVFCSDNGLFQGEHGFGGKTMMYEESVHVPMIVYSPFLDKQNRGAQVDSIVVGQDIPATILDLCDLKIPATYQGQSMEPLLEGKKVEWRKDVFLENLFTDQGYPRQEAVCGPEWKYIRYFSKDNDRRRYLPAGVAGEQPIYEELFNIKNDPREQHNLAGNPEYAGILNTYRARCQTLVAEMAK